MLSRLVWLQLLAVAARPYYEENETPCEPLNFAERKLVIGKEGNEGDEKSFSFCSATRSADPCVTQTPKSDTHSCISTAQPRHGVKQAPQARREPNKLSLARGEA
jgi:hypothetical protein